MKGIKKMHWLPPELHFELASFLPLNSRWGYVRVSSILDGFILKKQFSWIKNIFASLNDLGRARNKLLQAVRNVSGARLLFVSRQLVIVAKIWGNPNITFDIGIEQDDPDIPYTFGQFEAQLNAICSLVSNLESADVIRHVASFLDVTADLFIYTG